MNKILYTAMSIVGVLLTVAFFTISSESKASFFDGLSDAITGHIEDIKDRNKADTFVDGDVMKSSTFTWSSDPVHYADGGVTIVEKDGEKFVQLGKDFNAGFAPDLYIYLAEGHIKSDYAFNQARKLELGKLIKGEGASYYKIPSYLHSYADENFSVVIHCKRFNEPMGAAHF